MRTYSINANLVRIMERLYDKATNVFCLFVCLTLLLVLWTGYNFVFVDLRSYLICVAYILTYCFVYCIENTDTPCGHILKAWSYLRPLYFLKCVTGTTEGKPCFVAFLLTFTKWVCNDRSAGLLCRSGTTFFFCCAEKVVCVSCVLCHLIYIL